MRGHLRAVVHEFARTLLEPYDVAELLHRVTEHAVAGTGASGAGIMLRRDGDLAFAAASDDTVTVAERLQDRIDEGVCRDAFKEDHAVIVEDLRVVGRWPNYTPRVLGLGFHAVVGVPMNVHGTTIGVLNVYREEAGPWDAADVETCQLLADMAAGYVLYATALEEQVELSRQLDTALHSRAIIEQAKGVLMASERIDEATAFKWLREASMSSNRKLRDIAREVVDRAAGGDRTRPGNTATRPMSPS